MNPELDLQIKTLEAAAAVLRRLAEAQSAADAKETLGHLCEVLEEMAAGYHALAAMLPVFEVAIAMNEGKEETRQ